MSIIQSTPTLPSTGRLLRATAVAIVVAGGILVTTVLPAEYGIDPTGIGARLGLTALAQVDAASEPVATTTAASASTPAPALDAVGQPAKPVQDSMLSKREAAYRQHAMELTLEPGKGAEIKAQMKSGDGMVFHWTASAEVAVDIDGRTLKVKGCDALF
jgi:zona occludens toxin (predicted ATPase)